MFLIIYVSNEVVTLCLIKGIPVFQFLFPRHSKNCGKGI